MRVKALLIIILTIAIFYLLGNRPDTGHFVVLRQARAYLHEQNIDFSSPIKVLLDNGKILLLYHETTRSCFSRTAKCEPAPAHHPRLINKNTLLDGEILYYYAEKVEIYDPVKYTVQEIKAPHYAGHATATKLKNGKILLTGGRENLPSLRWLISFADCNFESAAEIFDPDTNTFRKTGRLNIARENHTATLLKDGMVLITGGMDCSSCDSGENLCGGTPPAELYIPE